MLFGDENAWNDKLLKECYIEQPKDLAKKSIIMGKWGIGKSAFVLHEARYLIEECEKTEDCSKDIWNIGEYSIGTASLAILRKKYADNELFKRTLENIWIAEIVRSECILFYQLRKQYESYDGDHWNQVISIGHKENRLPRFWDRIPALLFALGEINLKGLREVEKMQGTFGETLRPSTLENINKCLIDINDQKVQPFIVIEPIDTPRTELDEGGFALPLVTSLLNVFTRIFIKYQEPSQWIRICIPWHRYRPDNLDNPNRIIPYMGSIEWDRENLKDFINRRIEWEFRRVNRRYAKRNAWNELFPRKINHRQSGQNFFEDSFLFIRRHTHWRPRELQRITRMAVENQSCKLNQSVEDILRRGQIAEDVIEDTVNEFCRTKFENELTEEAKRRYGDTKTKEIKVLLYGLPNPFNLDDLNKKIKKYQKNLPEDLRAGSLMNILKMLYDSGFIGLEIIPSKDVKILNDYINIFGLGTHIYHKEPIQLNLFYLFQYNYDKEISDVINIVTNRADAKLSIVFHPSTWSAFGAASACNDDNHIIGI